MVLNAKRAGLDYMLERNVGGEALVQVVQKNCECPIAVSDQGHIGWDLEQPDLVEGVPARSSGIGTKWALRFSPTHCSL